MTEIAQINLTLKEQFGSRVDHSAIEVVMYRLLFCDIVRQQQYNAALGSYSSAQCHD